LGWGYCDISTRIPLLGIDGRAYLVAVQMERVMALGNPASAL
jgi:hypothetical protein